MTLRGRLSPFAPLSLALLLGCPAGPSGGPSGDDDDKDADPVPLSCSSFAEQASGWPLPSSFVATEEVLDTNAQIRSNRGCANSEELSFTLLDLDGDARQDLVLLDDCDVEGVGTARWRWYRNTGSGFENQSAGWPLPSSFVSTEEVLDTTAQLGSSRGCANSEALSFTLLDLDGDERQDLVLLDDCDVEGVGTARWRWYRNTGSGFEDQSAGWSLPSSFTSTEEVLDTTAQIGSRRGCANSEHLSFTLLDLDGDGRPDLVLLDDCDVAGTGTDRWLWYRNTGSGFADQAASWSLPSSFTSTEEILDTTAQIGSRRGCANSEHLSFTLLDLDGDGRLDLVLLDDCDVAGTGTDRWLWYRNTGSGFAEQAAAWPLPDSFVSTEEVLDTTAQIGSSRGCANNEELAFSLLDLSGDRRPDLVLLDDCDVAGTGTDRWIVFENTGSGFANTSWAFGLPASFTASEEVLDTTTQLRSSRGCSNSEEMSFIVSDLDGDGGLDLVLLDDCDVEGIGTGRWLFYPGVCQ